MWWTAYNGLTGMAQDLLDAGAPASGGLAPAVHRNHSAMVRLLLREGANPNKPGDHGFFPLALAAMNNNPHIVEDLLNSVLFFLSFCA